MYLGPLLDGLATTARHFMKTVRGEGLTRQFPEERPEFGNPLIYRGVHRLNKDDQGRVKCVACFLCATACPAHCIDIIGTEAPGPTARSIRRASSSTSCAASIAECAKKPVPSMRLSSLRSST